MQTTTGTKITQGIVALLILITIGLGVASFSMTPSTSKAPTTQSGGSPF